ncbi:D-mannonate oxidoreductase [Candidatus Desantisbacteria bacterium CG07_land_8_20_14_0_80_39_15]|uniref:D-mannonate oxidoreductase n=1 Tax=Candidatus Desantisbacteria bacterium CG07_land_8_20_14_0_80_39_15 TaxID=1974549 RepID=A0A2M6ZI18_9BACT|nr:MAG: D-mannonate oxidoreductase [Candidatus Desantisbacteria bacterium CG07_land_8_20_14_0_80_39_15]
MGNILEMFILKGKIAVITGGAGILGSEIARGIGKAGAKIAICDIIETEKIVDKLKEEKIEAKGYFIDVMDKNKIKNCCNEVIKDFGKVDILLNAAGGNKKEATTSKELSFFDLPFDALQKVVFLNLFGGAILPSQIFGKEMIKNEEGGSIINISSMAAFRPLTRTCGYSSAKAAVSNFTQWLAVHFASEYNKNLRVNAIAPGFFLTEQNRFLLQDEKGNLIDRGKSIIAHTPMRRFGEPEELIGACIWLASDASSFVTGVILPIDGGFNAFSGV